jgi:hypothetical protein
MRKLPAATQEERRRQVIGLRQGGMTYAAIAAQVGLTRTGCSISASGLRPMARRVWSAQARAQAVGSVRARAKVPGRRRSVRL